MLDSLVRVSRRVYENHFVRIAKMHAQNKPSTQSAQPAGLCPPSHGSKQGPIRTDLRRTLSSQRDLKQIDDIGQQAISFTNHRWLITTFPPAFSRQPT